MSSLAGILVVVALTLIILVIRFAISSVVNKGADAIHNAIAEKKNREQQVNPVKLSDRFNGR